MMDPVHIRFHDIEGWFNYCLAKGGSISEKHYMKSITDDIIRQHVASLNMCKSCIGLIEQKWVETLKLKRERAEARR